MYITQNFVRIFNTVVLEISEFFFDFQDGGHLAYLNLQIFGILYFLEAQLSMTIPNFIKISQTNAS